MVFVTMVTMLPWLQCHYGYNVTAEAAHINGVMPWVIWLLLLWLQCYYGYNVTLVKMLPWLQCHHGYNVTMVTMSQVTMVTM